MTEIPPPDEAPVVPEEPDCGSLIEALALAEIELPDDQVEQLDTYRHLLWDWNGKLNLTRHTTFNKFVTRDLVDTLELAKLLERGERVLDVGSGGGVPGIILAIVRPDLRVSLCESVKKKAVVLQSMIDEMGLPVMVYASRAEDLLEATTFDTLVARAVASMKKMLTWLAPRWDAFDRLLLIKGRKWPDERGEARHYSLLNDKDLRKVSEYLTPRSDAQSVILSITEKQSDK